jgi:3-deoxy-manno-octulosonate cytidylyltransferase (CMP-KDO synthetase)
MTNHPLSPTPAAPRVIGLIPARLASTRLPGKVLADIDGKPMVQHVYERACESELLAEVVVATDEPTVVAAVEGFGGQAVLTACNHASGTDRLAEAVQHLKGDLVVNLQGDEPLLRSEIIDAAIIPFLSEPGLRMGTIATPIKTWEEYQQPSTVKVVCNLQGLALYFSRSPLPHFRLDPGDELSPEAPVVHPHSALTPLKHIGLYVYTRDTLLWLAQLPRTPLEISESLEQLRALENGCPIRVVTVDYSPAGVDTVEDLQRVREMMTAERQRAG